MPAAEQTAENATLNLARNALGLWHERFDPRSDTDFVVMDENEDKPMVFRGTQDECIAFIKGAMHRAEGPGLIAEGFEEQFGIGIGI